MTPHPARRLSLRSVLGASSVLTFASQLAFLIPSSAHADATADSRFLQLPPFLVQDSKYRFSLSNYWGYMSFPGYEVLTGCDRGATNAFVMGAARQLSILHDIAPAVFEAQASVPTSLILMNAVQARNITDDMERVMAGRPADPNIGTASLTTHVIYFPQLRLHDSESTVINLILGDPRAAEAVILEPGYVRYLMESRIPRLPAWYVEAMTDLYRNAIFSTSAVETDAQGRLTLGSMSVTFSPISWIPEGDSAATRPGYTRGSELLPMESILFARTPPGGPDEASRTRGRLWHAQSDLLLQWVITDKQGGRIGALKRFLDFGDAGRRDEVAFRACFGLGFAEIREELADSLPRATEASISWHSKGGDVDEPYRDATAAETSRIWGNWELMEIQYVRARDPGMVYPYVNQAEHTLDDSYKKGLRDPGFLSVMGLYESDKNRPTVAAPLLESAVDQKAEYPRAYVELSRIRLREALGDSKGAHGRLGPAQIAYVSLPLRAARRLSPPQKATYMLLALALVNSDAPPSPEDFAALDEGVRLFPAESELATMVAALKDRREANGVPPESNGR